MRKLATVAALVVLAGCVQTQEMQMSQNVYRLQLSSGGIGAQDRVTREATKRAAALTLSKGYTHFVLADAGMSSNSQVIGSTPVTASTYGRYTTFSGGVPIRRNMAEAGITVVMFREGEPGAVNAIDARTVPQE